MLFGILTLVQLSCVFYLHRQDLPIPAVAEKVRNFKVLRHRGRVEQLHFYLHFGSQTTKNKAFIALAVGIGYERGAVVERCDGWRGIRGLAERSC